MSHLRFCRAIKLCEKVARESRGGNIGLNARLELYSTNIINSLSFQMENRSTTPLAMVNARSWSGA